MAENKPNMFAHLLDQAPSSPAPQENMFSHLLDERPGNPSPRPAATPDPYEAEDEGFGAIAQNIGLSLLSGTTWVPQAVVGLADLISTPARMGYEKLTGNEAGTFTEGLAKIGINFSKAQEIAASYKTDGSKEDRAEVNKAFEEGGVLEGLGSMAENPSVAVEAAFESLPSMLSLAGMTRLAALRIYSTAVTQATGTVAVRAAAGQAAVKAAIPRLAAISSTLEGAQVAGMQASDMAQDGLTGKEALSSVGAGITTATIGRISNRVGARLGLEDVEAALASGGFGIPAAGGVLSSAAKGGLKEGLLEEMPQSITEEMWKNFAEGNNVFEGTAQSGAEGAVVGALMGFFGGGASSFRRGGESDSNVDADAQKVAGTVGAAGTIDEVIAAASAGIDLSGSQDEPVFENDYNEEPVEEEPEAKTFYNEETDRMELVPEPEPEIEEVELPVEPPEEPPMGALAQKVLDQLEKDTPSYTEEQQSEVDDVDSRIEDARIVLNEANSDLESNDDPDSGLDIEAESAAEVLEDLEVEREDIVNRLSIEAETGRTEEEVSAEIDQQANEAATSPENDLAAPTEAQIESGNSKLGHVKVSGFDVSVENPRGSDREGVNPDGTPWKSTMTDHYGYIKRTKGADGEQVDVFVGKNPFSDKVFIVDQDNQSGEFDEHKVMMGYKSEAEAIEAYKSNYDASWKVGPVSQLTKSELKTWLAEGDNTIAFAPTQPSDKGGAEKPKTRSDQYFEILSEEDKGFFANMPAGEKRDRTIKQTALRSKDNDRNAEAHRLEERHKSEDALANPESTEAELIAATLNIESSAPYGIEQVADVQKDLDKIKNNYNGVVPKSLSGRQIYQVYLVSKKLKESKAEEVLPIAAPGRELEIPTALAELVEEMDIEEKTAADIAGEPQDRAVMITLRNIIDDGNDVMNDGWMPEDIRESATGLSQRIDAALESGDITAVQTEAKELIKEWTDSGSLAEVGPAFKAIEASLSGIVGQDSKPATKTRKVTPQLVSNDRFKSILAISADSVEQLRKPDVYRVLDNAGDPFRLSMAGRIKTARPDLAGEVDSVMSELNSPEAMATKKYSSYEDAGKGAMARFNAKFTPSGIASVDSAAQGDFKDGFRAASHGLLSSDQIESALVSASSETKDGIREGMKIADQFPTGSIPETELKESVDRVVVSTNKATKETSESEVIDSIVADDAAQAKASELDADPRRGEVGGMYAEGDVLVTSSGRETSPYPKIDTSTNGKAANTLKRVDAWLKQNAVDEANYREDTFNGPSFEAEDPAKLPPASKDSMEEYLFGEQPEVIPPIGKPLSAPAPKQQPLPNDFGKSNKLFTEEIAEKARAELRASLSTLTANVDPKLMQAGIMLSGYYIEGGARQFAAYSKAMINDAGAKIKPYLPMLYEAIRRYPGVDNTGMTPESEVEQFLQAEADNGQLDRDGESSLDGVSTEEVQGADGSGADSAEQGAVSGGGTDDAGSGTTAGDRPTLQYGMGTSEGGVSPADTRSGSDGEVRGGGLEGHTNSVDFNITDDLELGAGGQKAKYRGNVEAIRLLKDLQEKGLKATPDQQAILAKYVGWGGIKQVFAKHGGIVAKGWEKESAELRELLTDEEHAAAQRSTLDAHYTSQMIVNGIYKAVQRLGFRSGSILEPAMGAGNFFGLMPSGMRSQSKLNGVELDNITGGIAQLIYPSANIKSPMGFEDFYMKDGSFDLAIGNPPFGSQAIYDGKRKGISKFSIHNYFFGKSIDGLKDNGILAMVVSSGLMDKVGTKERAYFADRVELLGAVRLPNNAFKENANTEVTTDIIFLRKLAKGETSPDKSWIDTKPFKGADGTSFTINSYFANNPNMMLGEMRADGKMYRPGAPALIADENQDTEALLDEAIDRLPKNVYVKSAPVKFETEKKSSLVGDVRAKYIKPLGLYYSGNQIKQRIPTDDPSEFSFANKNGRMSSTGKPSDYNKGQISRIKGMVDIGIALSQLIEGQLSSDTTDEALKTQRKKLNTAYKKFVESHGFINSTTNRSLMNADPSWPRISSLESNYDKGVSAAVSKSSGQPLRAASAGKADIFEKRTQRPYKPVTKVGTVEEGLSVSMSELGIFDPAHISALINKTEEQVIKELGDLVYQDPVDGWQTREQYLSGNVKLKLQQAKDSAKENSKHARNVEALESVIPADIESVNINTKIGAPWLPAQIMSDFVDHLAGKPVNARFAYSKVLSSWSISRYERATKLSTIWGAYGGGEHPSVIFDAVKLIDFIANNKQPKVYKSIVGPDGNEKRVVDKDPTDSALAKTKEIKEEFEEWIWNTADRRESLGKIYNETYNTNVNRVYNGSHLKLPGSVIELFPTQKNFIWRVLQGKTALADHVVGAGKTFAMVGAAMELKRTGLADKPMIVVPNHLVQQWSNEFLALYPNANILVPTKDDFRKDKRKELIARVATGDWDAVILAHSSFKKLPSDKEETKRFIETQIKELSESIEQLRSDVGKDPRSIRDAEKAKTSLDNKLKALLDTEDSDEDNFSFTELGVDALFVDEAHDFKNLPYQTSQDRLPGLGNPTGSQKAQDMFVKTQSILRKTGGRNVVFATGTPVSNSMVELYTMQRYLGNEELKSKGLAHADAWINLFGDIVTDTEIDTTGQSFRMATRLAKFVNMGELLQMYNEFADSITRDDINEFLKTQGKALEVPKVKGGKPELVIIPRSQAQGLYMEDIIERSENIPADKSIDNMLKITGDARKMALDIRLVDPDAAPDAENKVTAAVRNIKKIADQWESDKGVQLVFLDLSTPKKTKAREKATFDDLVAKADKGDESAVAALEKYSPDDISALDSDFSVYDEMKSKLMEEGFAESEIAFIHDANTDDQKNALFGRVRSSAVRVLMGSTMKMGAGMNVQDRLVALHHIDAPWRPSDLEQREGRIIRQKNLLYKKYENFEVEILRYATDFTYDSRMWQTIEAKARFIEQMRAGDVNTREIEDISGEAANAAEMKAVASGNPLILEEFELRSKISKLEGVKKSHNRKKNAIGDAILRSDRRIESLPSIIDAAKKDEATLSSNPFEPVTKDNPTGFLIEIGGRPFTSRADAGKVLVAKMEEFDKSGRDEDPKVGTYRGFDISFERLYSKALSVSINGARDYHVSKFNLDAEVSGSGAVTRIANALGEIPDGVGFLTEELSAAKIDIEEMRESIQGDFNQNEELAELKARQKEVVAELTPKEEDKPVVKEFGSFEEAQDFAKQKNRMRKYKDPLYPFEGAPVEVGEDIPNFWAKKTDEGKFVVATPARDLYTEAPKKTPALNTDTNLPADMADDTPMGEIKRMISDLSTKIDQQNQPGRPAPAQPDIDETMPDAALGPAIEGSTVSLRAFRGLGQNESSVEQTKNDAIETLGFDPDVEVVMAESGVMAPKTPMRYNLETGQIEVNPDSPASPRWESAQFMVEEMLHHVDVVGQQATISASSPLFAKDGAVYREAERAFKGINQQLSRFLAYPLHDHFGLTQTEKQAELFARLGVLYLGDPQLLQEIMPNAFELYQSIFAVADNNSLRGEVRTGTQGSGEVSGQLGRPSDVSDVRGNAESSDGPTDTRSGLGRFRDTVVEATQGDRLGSRVQLSGNYLSTRTEGFQNWVPSAAVLAQVKDPLLSNEGLKQRGQSLRRKLQDKHIVWRDVQDAIVKLGGKLSDFSDAYNKFTLIEGRIGEKIAQVGDRFTEPLRKGLLKHDVGFQELGDFLMYMHAPERNAKIADRNEEMPDGGSGIMTKTAEDYIAAIPESRKIVLQELAQIIYDMQNYKLELLVTSGRMAASLRDQLMEDKFYVPLKGSEDLDDVNDMVFDTSSGSKGFDQTKDIFKTAKGRSTIAADIVATAVTDTVEGIISAEKNMVGQSILKFVQDNPNQNLWKVNPVKVSKFYNKKTGQVEQRVVSNYKQLAQNPNVFITWVDGKPFAIEFRDGKQSALARAVKNMGVDAVPWYIQNLASLNRWLSYVNTALSPEFLLTNPARDIQTALAKAFGDYDAKISGLVIKNLKRAIRGARHGLGDRANFDAKFATEDPILAGFIKEYLESGGKTDYFRSKTVQEMRVELERNLMSAKSGVLGSAERAIRQMGKYVEHANGILENATRISMYITLREEGYSRHQAATAAKNLTVNFNRKGEDGVLINSLYLFYNASIQGGHLTLRLMKNPKVQKLMVALGGAAIGLVQYNILMGGDDEDGEPNYFRVDNYEKERNLIIMWPDGSGRFTKFPLPYGLNVPINAAQSLAHMLNGRGISGQSPMEQAAWVAGSAWNSFSPLGEHGWNIVAPTVIDPFVDIALNRNFADSRIMPDKNPYESVPAPDSRRAFSKVDPWWKWTAETLNDLSTGNDQKAGYVDISPESIEHLVNNYTGAAGGFVSRVATWVSDPEMETERKPFIRKVYGKVSEYVVSDRYNDNKANILYIQERMEYLGAKSGNSIEDKAAMNDFRENNMDGLKMAAAVRSTEGKLRRLYSDRRELRIDPETNKDKIDRVENIIDREKAEFNKRYNKVFMP